MNENKTYWSVILSYNGVPIDEQEFDTYEEAKQDYDSEIKFTKDYELKKRCIQLVEVKEFYNTETSRN